MFSIGLKELIVLVLAVAAFWFGVKLIGRLREARKRGLEERRRVARGGGSTQGADPEDMVQCPACKTYIPVQAVAACGRDDCPY